MADSFDPYHKWLAIPTDEQPPHHYRLLGVRIFETDADVIEAAAQQRMAHVRLYQTGVHSEASQRLLNELATAQRCLLAADKRRAYDRELRFLLGGSPPDLPAPSPENQGVTLDFVRPNEAQLSLRRRRHNRSLPTIVVAISAIALAVIAVTLFVKLTGMRQPIAVETQPVLPPSPPATSPEPAEDLPAFPTITPHQVELPDPPKLGLKQMQEWFKNQRPGNKPLPKTTPQAQPTKPAPATAQPTKPETPKPAMTEPADSQRSPLPPVAGGDSTPPARRRTLADWITSAVKERKLQRTLSGGGAAGGSSFVEVPAAGALLVGCGVTLADAQTITSFEPAYVSPRGTGGLDSTRFGTERGRAMNVTARRGYAVGAVNVQGENKVDGFELVFMRITSHGLNVEDAYKSPWIGLRSNQPELTLGGDGLPVVGVYGRAGAALFSLGLIQAPAE